MKKHLFSIGMGIFFMTSTCINAMKNPERIISILPNAKTLKGKVANEKAELSCGQLRYELWELTTSMVPILNNLRLLNSLRLKKCLNRQPTVLDPEQLNNLLESLVLAEKKETNYRDFSDSSKNEFLKSVTHLLPFYSDRYQNSIRITITELLYQIINNSVTKFKKNFELWDDGESSDDGELSEEEGGEDSE